MINPIKILIPLLLFSTFVHAEVSPKMQLESTITGILSTIKDTSLSKDVKDAKIIDLVNERFNYSVMAKRTLSVNWKKATTEQREQITQLFTLLLRRTYLNNIKMFTNEVVEFNKQKIRKNSAIVYTVIITSTSEIPINYKMTEKNGQWMVYDVTIEGISLIRNYSSTFREIVKKEGIDGLIKRMESKLQN